MPLPQHKNACKGVYAFALCFVAFRAERPRRAARRWSLAMACPAAPPAGRERYALSADEQSAGCMSRRTKKCALEDDYDMISCFANLPRRSGAMRPTACHACLMMPYRRREPMLSRRAIIAICTPKRQ